MVNPMITFPRRMALLALAAVLFAGPLLAQEIPRAVPEAVGMSSERLERITTTLDSYVQEGRLAGAATTHNIG